MIKSEHVRDDLEVIKAKGDAVTLADVCHSLSLLIKVALDNRQNQVATMKKEGVSLSTHRVAPKKED